MNTILIMMTFVAFILTIGLRYGAQALVTSLLGDGSLAREHRLTVNPARHMASLGTWVGVIFSFPIGGGLPAGLGWGRPVRPDATRLSVGANSGTILVALSGIVTNFVVGIVVAVGLGFIPFSLANMMQANGCLGSHLQGGPLQSCLMGWQPGWALRLEEFALVFASVNILVGLLNLIPLYPLDGYSILFALLPERAAINYRNSQATQELILAGILLLVPFLFNIARVPQEFAPSYLLQLASYKILSVFDSNLLQTLLFL
jgi:Zn-dependent protease